MCNEQMWHELFGIWLETIGGKILIGRVRYSFRYYGNEYIFSIYKWVTMELDVRPHDNNMWFRIHLNLDVDIMDPSFNPNAFFEPIKQRLETHRRRNAR